MSRTRTAIMRADHRPDTIALNRALKAKKLRLIVDPDWTARARGYIPCTLDGEDAGFDLRDAVGSDGRLVLSFRWSGDQREKASALSVLSVLASSFGAEVVDPDSATRFAPEQLHREVHGLLHGVAEHEHA